MLKRRYILTAFVAYAVMGRVGTIAASESNTLDGYWFSDQWKYAFKIEGLEGVAVLSNSPRYSPGQVMLRFHLTTDGILRGQQIFTDGSWVDVTGRIVSEDVLELRGGGHTWRMVRR